MESNEYFQITWHGNVAVVEPSPAVENLPDPLIESAASVVLAPLRASPPTDLIVDLHRVPFVNSAFLSFLLQCHRLVRARGCEMHLAGCSEKIKELLHLMNFDTLWAIYDTRQEALEAVV